MRKFIEEQNVTNKEAVFGALSSFLRAENYNGKKEFIKNKNGLQWLNLVLKDKANSDRMSKKVLFLINDLVTLDKDAFPEDETYTRRTLPEEPEFLNRLFELLMKASEDFSKAQNWDIRENSLNILIEIFDVKPTLRDPYVGIITNLKLKLA